MTACASSGTKWELERGNWPRHKKTPAKALHWKELKTEKYIRFGNRSPFIHLLVFPAHLRSTLKSPNRVQLPLGVPTSLPCPPRGQSLLFHLLFCPPATPMALRDLGRQPGSGPCLGAALHLAWNHWIGIRLLPVSPLNTVPGRVCPSP